MTQHTRQTLLEERACPDCGDQDVERALYNAEPVPCSPCRIRRGIERGLQAKAAGVHYCAPCGMEIARPGIRKHEASKFHRTMAAIFLPAPAAALALDERRTA